MKRFLTPRNIIGLIVALALMYLSKKFLPVPMPHIQMPAETVFTIGDHSGFPITNTMIHQLTGDLILILLALMVGRRMNFVPGRLQGLFELIVEFWRNQADQLIGKELTGKLLPLVLTMFLTITVTNWLELVPGVDTIGIACIPGEGVCPGEDPENLDHSIEHTLFSGFEPDWAPGLFVATARDESDHGDEAESHEEGNSLGFGSVAYAQEEDAGESHADAAATHEEGAGQSYALVTFYRVTASDLNFTLALALIAFVVIEWAGIRALGFGYFKKFINIDFSHGAGQGFLNFFVGIIETISEVARVIAFTFRLFGNLFAGQMLLFIVPFLIPLFAVLPFYGLETFVGMIQGFVFAILTLVFVSLAITPHAH